jgi:hypothetical protein
LRNWNIFINVQAYFILEITKIPDEIIDEKHVWKALFKAKTEMEAEDTGD